MKQYKVLITDDIYANRLLLSVIVNDLGHECYLAENGKEAIDIIKKEDIDVVLMDIEMPVMNGIETVQYIRKEIEFPKKNIPVIALTAHDPKSFFEDYSDVGFTYLITKPYSINKLEKILNKYLEG